MLRILLVGTLLATPLSADDLVGGWSVWDSDAGDVILDLYDDRTFYLAIYPSESFSEVIVDNVLRFFVPYTLAELTDSGMRETVVQYIEMNGTYSGVGDTLQLHHPEGAIHNIDGHEFNTWELVTFLASSILAGADLELSDGYKEHLIFLADAYMVEVMLDEALLTTKLGYDLSEGDLTSLTLYGLMGKEETTLDWRGTLIERTATGVEGATWGEIKSSLPFR